LEVEMELPDGKTYETAENLGIFPENDQESVDIMLSSLNLSGNEVFRLNRTDKPGIAKLPCPTPISVRDFLGRFIDHHGKLKPSVMKKMAKFATDPDTLAALNQLLEKGSRAMTDFNTKKFGLVNLFEHNNISIKLGQLVQVSTRIPARYYTIASGSKSNPSMIKICVSLTIEDMNTNTFYGPISKNLSDMKARFDKSEALLIENNALEINIIFTDPKTDPVYPDRIRCMDRTIHEFPRGQSSRVKQKWSVKLWGDEYVLLI
jgi:sulfite reductase (NADPH) flavoprotein alpha-component